MVVLWSHLAASAVRVDGVERLSRLERLAIGQHISTTCLPSERAESLTVAETLAPASVGHHRDGAARDERLQ